MQHSKLSLKLPLLFAIAILVCFQSNSQEIWTLERCINYALENNITIKQQSLNSQISENALAQSRLNRLPSFNANMQQSYNYGRTLDFSTNIYEDQNTRSFSYNASSQVTLFNGFQITNSIRQSSFDLMASIAELDKLKNDISINIASLYLQILFNKELLAIARNQVEITGEQVERTRKLVEAGSLPMGNLLEIKAQQASENLRVVNASNQLNLSYLSLSQLLELPAEIDLQIEIPDFEYVPVHTPEYSVGAVYETALLNQPSIRTSEYRLSSTELGLKIAQGRRYPRLALSSNYGSGYQKVVSGPGSVFAAPSFEDQIQNNQRTSVSLGLSIPIFNAGQVNTAISNAQIAVLNSEYSMQRVKNQLYQEIEQAFADVIAAHENYLATQIALESIEESFRYVSQRFEVGMITTVEFNQSLNQLTTTRSELLRAKYEYIFKTNILEFYLGNPIRI